MINEKTVTPEEAAELLQIHVATVYRMIQAGTLPTTGPDYGQRIPAAAVTACRVKVCDHCGERFAADHGRQVYCSDRCRFNAGNKRKRERAQKGQDTRPQAQRKIIPAKVNKRLEAALRLSRKLSR